MKNKVLDAAQEQNAPKRGNRSFVAWMSALLLLGGGTVLSGKIAKRLRGGNDAKKDPIEQSNLKRTASDVLVYPHVYHEVNGKFYNELGEEAPPSWVESNQTVNSVKTIEKEVDKAVVDAAMTASPHPVEGLEGFALNREGTSNPPDRINWVELEKNPAQLADMLQKIQKGICRDISGDLLAHEGCINYFYVCSQGGLTYDKGCNIDSTNVFCQVDLCYADGRKVPPEEMLKVYADYMKAKDKLGGNYDHKPEYYKEEWKDLPQPDPNSENNKKLGEVAKTVHYGEMCLLLKGWGVPAQLLVPDNMIVNDQYRGIIMSFFDMMYNMGRTNFTDEKWPNFTLSFLTAVEAYAEGDMKCFRACIKNMAEESKRPQVQDLRNEFCRASILQCLEDGFNPYYLQQVDWAKLHNVCEKLKKNPKIKDTTKAAIRHTTTWTGEHTAGLTKTSVKSNVGPVKILGEENTH
ncbi:MAG: hypothetical protein ILP11_00155 [Alphaproteobacteria bacterium]|nr:hypothetical protein [Alphaproteobacteria bacterium]